MRHILYLWVPHLHTRVEQGWDAALKDQPVVVAAGRFQRGTVIDASPEAEAMGAGAGMTWRHAHRRCPTARFIRYERPRYTPVVEQIGAVLTRFTPWAELLPGREDEFFADLSAAAPASGYPAESALLTRRIQTALAAELSLETRAALAAGKFPARTLCRAEMPGSICNLQFAICNFQSPAVEDPLAADQSNSLQIANCKLQVANCRSALAPLSIDTLWELKPEVREQMLLLGLRTLGQLAAVPQRLLVEQFGPAGRWYRLLARGIDHRRVAAWQPSPTVAELRLIDDDEPTLPILEAIVDDLADRVSERLLRAGQYARTLTLIAHLEGGDRRFATHHLKAPVHLRCHLFDTATALLLRISDFGFRISEPGVNKDAHDRQKDEQDKGMGSCSVPGSRASGEARTTVPEDRNTRTPEHLSSTSCLSVSSSYSSLLTSESEIRNPKSVAALELRAGGLSARGVLQLSIFGETDRGPALRAAVARIQDRFGERAVRNAIQLLAELQFQI